MAARAAVPSLRLAFQPLGRAYFSSTASPLRLTIGDPAVTTSGVRAELHSWGRGSAGQLGGGIEEIRYYPTPVAFLNLPTDFSLAPVSGRLNLSSEASLVEAGVSCGLFHSGLLVEGKLWVWGKGDGGRLGLGSEMSAYVPMLNPHLESLRMVALGGLHSTALTMEGRVFTWGYGGFGALGHSVYHRELSPRQVENAWSGKICHLATSGTHTAAISDAGELYTWGRDEGEGRLGLGTGGGPDEGALGTPSRVDALPVPVAAVTCGGFFTMALTTDGQLWSWGGNSNFELGRGNNINDWRPQPVPSLDGVRIIQIASGGFHSMALTDDGKVLTWGHGRHGQLGHGSIQNQKVPVVVEALADEKLIYVACGGSSSAAITESGKLYMWGNSKDCQLGVPGLPEVQTLPVEVKFVVDDEKLGPPHVLLVAIGASHAMCLLSRPQAQTCD
ncbi:ultraviolet-B receptor UVR8 [Amborella trichopoda]|uniref:RCC1-like domain-containing protein n=1 Tax=Amborella trichopoda TaxID=13333 RepID=U5CXV1_AMBTC|nr:ultraviolet-B receptor UVR8 [Amborella trichopoda]ERN14979.1 hypothetical protein AMTR_s00032p00220610 [Amborella trichopoda]|eukprot:XP_020528366.1 ultraviolet-B receptor UVR8 [Amborella trichopoda]